MTDLREVYLHGNVWLNNKKFSDMEMCVAELQINKSCSFLYSPLSLSLFFLESWGSSGDQKARRTADART